MHKSRKITNDMYWVGGNDRKIKQFEGAIPLTNGISYNSYFVDDEKTVLLDTVDTAVAHTMFDNLEHLLKGRKLDYVIINHLEPDHSASLADLIRKYPEIKMIGTDKTKAMAKRFLSFDIEDRFNQIEEGDTLNTGRHDFTFVKAPMVHWPEVMVTYDKTDRIVYSADAFGTFNALSGNMFADEYDFDNEWLPIARLYYSNIVGKYGMFTEMLLGKLEEINPLMICPLHGPIIRKDIDKYIEVYHKWATYTPEIEGVLVIYASVYGNTKDAAEIVAGKLADLCINDMSVYDVSETDQSIILAEAFKYSHILVASMTHNGGIFVKMENALLDIKAHNLSNRKIAIIENGSWGPTSGDLIRALFEELSGMTFIDEKITIKSSVKENQLETLDRLAEAISKSVKGNDDLVCESTEEEAPKVKHVCTVCGYVFEEEKYGKWEDLADDFACPICKVGKEKFVVK